MFRRAGNPEGNASENSRDSRKSVSRKTKRAQFTVKRRESKTRVIVKTFFLFRELVVFRMRFEYPIEDKLSEKKRV